MISFTTTPQFRSGFRIATKDVQEEVEKVVQSVLAKNECGELCRWSKRGERIIRLKNHTLLFSINKNELILLDLYESNVFFAKN